MNRRTLHLLLKSLRSMLLITIPAIHRFCTVWFERYFTFFPTICTSRLMHFSWCAAKTTASVFSIHSYYFLDYALVLAMLYLNIYLHHSEEKTSDMPVRFKKNHIVDAYKVHLKILLKKRQPRADLNRRRWLQRPKCCHYTTGLDVHTRNL